MNNIYYNKYIKYILKYTNTVNKNIINNQYGGRKKTFYISIKFKINQEFIEYFKSSLIKKGWIESSKLPIDFIYIDDKDILQQFINDDSKKSKLINAIKGNTFNNIINIELFLNKYKEYNFIFPFKIVDNNNIPIINKTYRLRPIFGIGGASPNSSNYTRKNISSKEELEEQIKLNPTYKWIIRDLISNPVLLHGYRCALECIVIIKLNPFKIYICKKKMYNRAKKLFNKDIFYTDSNTNSTNPYNIYNENNSFINDKSDFYFFPDTLPDNCTKKDGLFIDKQINNTIQLIFDHKIDLQPDFNSKNGYYILNVYIELYEGLPPIINNILSDFYVFRHVDLIPALVSILIDNKDHPDFIKVDFNKKIKFEKNKNYKFERLYSFGRTTEYKPIKNTFYVNVTYDSDFENDMSSQLIKKGFKKSTDYPVEFIFLSGDCIRWKNRFDASGSKWISLLYGNSKTEICNKILLNKNFKDADFTIPGEYINSHEILNNNDLLNNITDNIKILKPLKGAAGDSISIVKTKTDIINWVKEHEKFNEWLLQDYLMNPDLIDGYKFHFRVLILVKVMKNKTPEIFMSNSQFYYTANEKYKKEDWLNKNIHDSHWKAGNIKMFPDYLPDNWDKQDATNAMKDMQKIIKKVFNNQNEFYPEWNATNGFELFGSDFIFENKHPYLLEINLRTGLKETNSIIPGVISTVLNNEENEYFTKLI